MTSVPARRFQHIILTRYLVRFSDAAADAITGTPEQRAWLEARFDLFRRYCLPSVAAQPTQDFTWLIYFDRNTPADQLERVRDLIRPWPNMRVMLCDRFDAETRRRDILALLHPDTDWLVTTRLDNDDGWRGDFIPRLQAEVRPGRREFLNFPAGILYHDGKTYLYRHDSNAFISLSEPVEDCVTVFCAPHTELASHGPVRRLSEAPAFLQVIHPGNRSNRPRGLRVHRTLAVSGFEAVLGAEPATPESDWSVVFSNVTTGIAWALRDWAVDLIRRSKAAVLTHKSS